jgi:cell division cycle protein 20 (cofactor of APC complex)
VWAPEYKELVSGHGYPNNQVVVWKFPALIKSAELAGHTDRVLHLAMSTDQTTVVSLSVEKRKQIPEIFPSQA